MKLVPPFPENAAIDPIKAGIGADQAHAETVYLAGPMTGYEEFNFPAFHSATAVLRAWGFTVISPAERDEADGFDPKNHAAQTHSYYMAIDLPLVCGADAVVVLPGWEKSSGAQMETAVAAKLGKPVVRFDTLEPVDAPQITVPVVDGTMKSTNPKDAIGSSKLPLHLWPETATIMGCVGLLDGMLKYGRSNWRHSGVRVSIYLDAIRRHLGAYGEGEDYDQDSGAPHLAHALACLAIIVDADAHGKLMDDRQYAESPGYRGLVETLTPHVERLKDKHAEKSPHHFTIGDRTAA